MIHQKDQKRQDDGSQRGKHDHADQSRIGVLHGSATQDSRENDHGVGAQIPQLHLHVHAHSPGNQGRQDRLSGNGQHASRAAEGAAGDCREHYIHCHRQNQRFEKNKYLVCSMAPHRITTSKCLNCLSDQVGVAGDNFVQAVLAVELREVLKGGVGIIHTQIGLEFFEGIGEHIAFDVGIIKVKVFGAFDEKVLALQGEGAVGHRRTGHSVVNGDEQHAGVDELAAANNGQRAALHIFAGVLVNVHGGKLDLTDQAFDLNGLDNGVVSAIGTAHEDNAVQVAAKGDHIRKGRAEFAGIVVAVLATML